MMCVSGECRDVPGSKKTSALFRPTSAACTKVGQSRSRQTESGNAAVGALARNELLLRNAGLSHSLSRLTTDSPHFHRTWSGSSLHPESLPGSALDQEKTNQTTEEVCQCCQKFVANGCSAECAGTKCTGPKQRRLSIPLGWKRLRRFSKPSSKELKRSGSNCKDYNSNHSPVKELVKEVQIQNRSDCGPGCLDQCQGLEIMSQNIPNVNPDKNHRAKSDRIDVHLPNGARQVYDKQVKYYTPIKPLHKMSRLIHVDGVSYKVTMEAPGQRQTATHSVLQHLPSNGLSSAAPAIVGGTVCSRPPGGGQEPFGNMAITAVKHGSASGTDRQEIRTDRQAPRSVRQVHRSGRQTPRIDSTAPRTDTGSDSLDSIAWTNERNVKAAAINLRQRDGMVDPKTLQALDHAALRLRGILTTVARGNVLSLDDLRQNLNYAIDALESRHAADAGATEVVSFEDEMSSTVSGETPVPPEIKRWLLQTFSNSSGEVRKKREKEKRSLRSVVHAVQAGMFVDRMFRKHSEAAYQLPLLVGDKLKDVDSWTFNVFDLEDASEGHSLKYVYYQLLSKYNFLRKFKISTKTLFAYCHRLEQGYRKHDNRYHNPIHAADVAQTINCMLVESGLTQWLSDMEIFSMITAAIVHDLEHTGTTNTFHANTRSELAQLYNDRSVLENHHVSTAFRIMQDEDCDILRNLEKDDYQECRALIIDMVLATDMSQHFGQIQKLKGSLQHPESLEKSRAMCLMIHAADVNHPAKPWHLHNRWTERLVFEFFEQGDKERELGLPLSPLCDRHATLVAQSQIGFIDFVIEPTFTLLYDMFRQVNGPVLRNAIAASGKRSSLSAQSSSSSTDEKSSLSTEDVLKRRFSDVGSYVPSVGSRTTVARSVAESAKECFMYIAHNRRQWVRKDAIEQEKHLFGEDAFTKAPPFTPEPIPQTGAPFENGTDPQRPDPSAIVRDDRRLDASNVTEPP